jgi:hypothetical protein
MAAAPSPNPEPLPIVAIAKGSNERRDFAWIAVAKKLGASRWAKHGIVALIATLVVASGATLGIAAHEAHVGAAITLAPSSGAKSPGAKSPGAKARAASTVVPAGERRTLEGSEALVEPIQVEIDDPVVLVEDDEPLDVTPREAPRAPTAPSGVREERAAQAGDVKLASTARPTVRMSARNTAPSNAAARTPSARAATPHAEPSTPRGHAYRKAPPPPAATRASGTPGGKARATTSAKASRTTTQQGNARSGTTARPQGTTRNDPKRAAPRATTVASNAPRRAPGGGSWSGGAKVASSTRPKSKPRA